MTHLRKKNIYICHYSALLMEDDIYVSDDSQPKEIPQHTLLVAPACFSMFNSQPIGMKFSQACPMRIVYGKRCIALFAAKTWGRSVERLWTLMKLRGIVKCYIFVGKALKKGSTMWDVTLFSLGWVSPLLSFRSEMLSQRDSLHVPEVSMRAFNRIGSLGFSVEKNLCLLITSI